jgi:hypothetical protein
MSESVHTEQSTPPPLLPSESFQSRLQTALVRLRPHLRQAWWNLKVWVPFLLNPTDRMRQVIYHARENREGFRWTIDLPDHCWKCDVQEGLWRRELERDLRGFEYAITVVAAAGGCFLFFVLLGLLTGWRPMYGLGLLSLVAGGAVLYAKSWTEVVVLHMSTCREHADDLPMPDMVTHENELHLFMPTDQLAAAARAQLRVQRQSRERGLPGRPRGAESDVEPPDPQDRYRSPLEGLRDRAVELPPIKLVDDDEEIV